MFLLIWIFLLSLLFLLMSDLIKLLHIPKYIKRRSENFCKNLQQELDVAMAELSKVKEMKFTDHYKYQIQLLRAEEAVKEINKKVRSEKNIADLKSASAEVIIIYCAKGLVSLILFIISVRNRYTPVAIFDEQLNFQPLTGILSFPTGVANALSVPMWVLSCNVTFNYVYNLLKLNK